MKDKVLFKNKWIEVRERDDWYTYTHNSWSNGQGVGVLGYRKNGDNIEYLGRYELTVCHSYTLDLSSLTGGMDKEGENLKICAMRELEEESGYVINDVRRFIELGSVMPSKSSDSEIFLYAIEINENDKKVEIVGDGTIGEENAYCDWVSKEEAINCKDPLVATMIARLDLKLN